MDQQNRTDGEEKWVPWRLHRIEKFLHIKGSNTSIEVSAYRMDRIFASYTFNKGLLSKIYKESKRTNQSINGLVI